MQDKIDQCNSVVELENLMRSFPEHKQELGELLLKSENFERLVSSFSALKILVEYFPAYKQGWYKLLVAPENFKYLVIFLAELMAAIEFFPEHKKELFILALESEQANSIVYSIDEFLDLVHFFPEHGKELHKFFIASFNRLVPSTREVKILADSFSEYREELYTLLIKPEQFNRLVSTTYRLIDLVECFPEHQEELFKLLTEHCERLVCSDRGLKSLSAVFPDKEILKNTDFKKAVRDLKKITNTEKGYTQGAVVGMFSRKIVPAEVASHIASYLDRSDGAQVASTRKKASEIAQAEKNNKGPKM